MSRRGAFLLAALLAAHAGPSSAETARPGRLSASAPREVGLRVGYDHAFITELSFSHATTVADVPVVVDAVATLPWRPDAGDYRVRVGATISFLGDRAWTLTARIAPTVRATDERVGKLLGLGADLSVVGGYAAQRWFVGGEAGLDAALATHVDHSDEYRMRVYADARDGWYSQLGGIMRLGAVAGLSLGGGDLALRVGNTRKTNLDGTLLPFYATLGYGYRW